MKFDVILPIVISSLSLVVSAIVAYKTFFRGFDGRVLLGNYLALNYINNFPGIVVFCFFENAGTKIGMLDDLLLVVEHKESGSSYKFIPAVTSSDYNILKEFSDDDWRAFNGIVLSPSSRSEKYIVFKPVARQFKAQKGHYNITMQIRWYGDKHWTKLRSSLPLDLSESDLEEWDQKKALQVATANILELR